MAEERSSSIVSATAPTLPELTFGLRSPPESEPASETTTLNNDRHDSITSPRSSLCSVSTDSLRTNPSAKQRKRVRFEDSVAWSYFDAVELNNNDSLSRAPESLIQRKPSFWQRFKQRNFSNEDATDLDSQLKQRNASMDALEMKPIRTQPSRPPLRKAYTVQAPIRETAGRRYTRADTHACWTATRGAAKGDWDSLLSNPRQSRLTA